MIKGQASADILFRIVFWESALVLMPVHKLPPYSAGTTQLLAWHGMPHAGTMRPLAWHAPSLSSNDY